MKITLGPIPYLWEKERILAFYHEIIDTPVSVVYVGEVVCSKRSFPGIDTVLKIGRLLQDAGKDVVISTLGLITDEEELEFLKALVELPFPVEINSIGVLNMIRGQGHVAGPHLAVYNTPTARFFAENGVRRIVFMPELHQEAIKSIAESVPSLDKEIIGFGNLPLASSWRCYTARTLGLSRSNCAISCVKYPEGMPLETMNGMPIFKMNGTQLMSAKKVCLIDQLESLRDMGIGFIRIIPQPNNTADVIDIFRRTVDGALPALAATGHLSDYSPEGVCNGWFFGKPGWEYVDKTSYEAGAGQASQPDF